MVIRVRGGARRRRLPKLCIDGGGWSWPLAKVTRVARWRNLLESTPGGSSRSWPPKVARETSVVMRAKCTVGHEYKICVTYKISFLNNELVHISTHILTQTL